MLRYRIEVLAQYQAASRVVREKREKAKTAQGPAQAKIQKELLDVRFFRPTTPHAHTRSTH